MPRKDWDCYWAWLEHERIACPRDRNEFDRHFTDSNRPHAVPRPGLSLLRRWPLEGAQAVDREDEFQLEVRHALDDALGAFVGRRGEY